MIQKVSCMAQSRIANREKTCYNMLVSQNAKAYVIGHSRLSSFFPFSSPLC